MMRSRGFKRPPQREAKQVNHTPPPTRAVMMTGPDRAWVPVPKANIVRDEGYLRLVASLPCCWCGIQRYSQAAHANEGKGMAIKASDVSAFPLCGPRPLSTGCHWLFDQGGRLTKERRRELEELWGNKTRMNLREAARNDCEAMVIVRRVIGL